MKVVLRDSKSPPACRLVLLSEKESVPKGDETLDDAGRELVERARKERLFRGSEGEVKRLLLPSASRPGSLVLLGLGKKKGLSAEVLRRAFGALARELSRQKVRESALALHSPAFARRLGQLGVDAAVRALVEGWHLGGYSFDDCKSEKKPKRDARLALETRGLPASDRRAARDAVRAGEAISRAVNFARDLANKPANELYPQSLASLARGMARRSGLRCRVLGEPEIRREKMGAFLGVAQGSSRPPRLIVVEYRPGGRGGKSSRKLETLVFIGKAVTFDSGGLSLKPARGMQEMKFDMAGGAAVLGALEALSRLEPRLHVVGIVPASENLISGSATRPGDVLRSASGKTIEVINTDAEGRLLLADALHYSRRFRPAAVVDIATLTGACVVALGSRVGGMVTTDAALGRRILRASEASGERIWELPLYDELYDAVKSRVADLKNSAGRDGGAITAGAFLASFIEGVPWAHLDIAGTAWSGRTEAYNPAGATGFGVRLLVELALSFRDRRR